MKRRTAPRTKWAVVTDFDGTVTIKDVGDTLLRRFKAATPSEIERSYARSVKIEDWMKKYFKPVHISRSEIEKCVLSTTRMRRGFAEFRKFCAKRGIPLEIASGGVDLYIDLLLKRWKLQVPAYRGLARFTRSGIAITYPFLKNTTLNVFKAGRVKHYQKRGYKVVFCGDGPNDFMAAGLAEAAFATKKLRDLCVKERVPSRRLKNFFEVKRFILKNT